MVIALSKGELLLKAGVIEVKVEEKLLHMNMLNTKIQVSAGILGLLSVSCIRCLIECLLHPLSDRETLASAV